MRGLLLLVAACLLLLTVVSPSSAQKTWRSCGTNATCGTVRVPADHHNAQAGDLKLEVKRWSAQQNVRRTIVSIAGGPGQPSIPYASTLRQALRPSVKERYNMIAVDQRGTGQNAVTCPTLQNTMLWTSKAIQQCVNRLGPLASSLSTAQAVLDLELIRKRLRLGSLTLHATSYGTQVAVAYARRFPQHVDQLILDSPMHTSGDVLMGARLNAAGPVIDRLLDIPGSGTGRNLIATATRSMTAKQAYDLGWLSVTAASDPTLQARLPGVLLSAQRGDLGPLRWLSSVFDGPDSGSGPVSQLSVAMYVATICNDASLPWVRSDPPNVRRAKLRQHGRRSGRVGGFPTLTGVHLGIAGDCVHWPSAGRRPVPSKKVGARTVILSGELDSNTSLEHAQDVARELSDVTVVPVAAVGHAVLSTAVGGCVDRAVNQALLGAVPESCESDRISEQPDTFEVSKEPLWAPTPRTLAEVPVRSRTNGDQMLEAIRITVADAMWISGRSTGLAAGVDVSRYRGIRSGTLTINSKLTYNEFRFRSFSQVGGVKITGTIKQIDQTQLRGTMKVTGALSGTLTLKRYRIEGTLNGTHVPSTQWISPDPFVIPIDTSISDAPAG